MKIINLSNVKILAALNKEEGDTNLIHWSEYGSPWDLVPFDMEEPVNMCTTGDIISVASTIRTLSPNDLQKDISHMEDDNITNFVAAMLSPSNINGDEWDFDELFNEFVSIDDGSDKQSQTLHLFGKLIHRALMDFIAEHPHVLRQDASKFFVVDKFKHFIFCETEDGDMEWRPISASEVKKIENQKDALRKKEIDTALSKLTPREKKLLGV